MVTAALSLVFGAVESFYDVEIVLSTEWKLTNSEAILILMVDSQSATRTRIVGSGS